jgi:hypothetical protein
MELPSCDGKRISHNPCRAQCRNTWFQESRGGHHNVLRVKDYSTMQRLLQQPKLISETSYTGYFKISESREGFYSLEAYLFCPHSVAGNMCFFLLNFPSISKRSSASLSSSSQNAHPSAKYGYTFKVPLTAEYKTNP